MLQSPLPVDERDRLLALQACALLDTPAEPRFDRLTRLARRLFQVPIALISLVDAERQWFKSRQGLDALETPRNISFCGHAILLPEPLVVEDTAADPRFADNPLVLGEPFIRFYAGAPLRAENGQPIGTLCVIDRRPRRFDAEDRAALRELADSVEDLIRRSDPLELRLLRRERELKHAYELLEKSSEAASIGTWEIDAVSGRAHWSRVTQRIHGVASDFQTDLEGSLAFFPEAPTRDTLRRAIRAAFQQQRGFDLELALRGGDGERRWVRLIGLPEIDHERCLRVYGLIQDISERRRADEAQRKSMWLSLAQAELVMDPVLQADEPEPAFQRLCEAVSDALNVNRAGIWLLTADTSQLVCRNLYIASDGRHESGMRFDSAQYPVYFAAIGLCSVVAADDAPNDVVTREFADSYLRPLGISSMLDAVIASDSGLLGVVSAEQVGPPRQWSAIEQSFLSAIAMMAAGIMGNATRRAAEARLAASERQFRNLIEDVPGAAYRCRLDADWTMDYLSDGIAQLVGWPADALLGNRDFSFASLIHPDDVDRVDAEVRSAIDEGRNWEIEYRLRHCDGGLRWVYEKGHALFDGEGRVESLSGFIHDISERKRLERVKSEFVSTVSHELRTPLTAICGALDLVGGGVLGPVPGPAKQMLDIARNNGRRLSFLINDLLDMEKLAAGKMEFDFKVLPLSELVEQALAANATYGAERAVGLQLRRHEAGKVKVDAQRLMQVLSNLLSNAIKYSPNGGQVEVEVVPNAFGLRVSVRDHGPGIPDKFKPRIFQKFSQADASDTRAKGGTGLGLAITRELVEHMGGRIGFDSIEGQGATFYVELPLIG